MASYGVVSQQVASDGVVLQQVASYGVREAGPTAPTGQSISQIRRVKLTEWAFSGIGTFVSQSGAYVGDWELGVRSGNGSAFYPDGSKFVGQFLGGRRHGYGIFTATQGDSYAGFFSLGVRDGQGMEIFPNGERYVGMYKVRLWVNKSPYELLGDADTQTNNRTNSRTLLTWFFLTQNDQMNGKGVLYYPNGSVKYAGDWLEGAPHGLGTYVLTNGLQMQGEFLHGRFHHATPVTATKAALVLDSAAPPGMVDPVQQFTLLQQQRPPASQVRARTACHSLSLCLPYK